MKKPLLIFMSLLILLGFAATYALAADTNVEISFKIGDSTLKVNGEDLTVETPYVVDGVTLVPLRVITESFGAEVTWHEETQEIDVDYEDVNIKLAIGSKDVYTNGMRSELLAAPELINGVTMLPLRFITENFGADVSYDEQTKAVLVTRDYVESNSIKDYASILKHSEKEYLGDSYYGWSMKRTSKLKMQSRSFDGRETFFEGENLMTRLAISNVGKDEVTLDSLLEDARTVSQAMSVINDC